MRTNHLARRLGAAALAITMGLGLAACGSSDGGTNDSSQSAETDGKGELVELSSQDFYPSLMSALMDAETFAMKSTSSANGQTTTIDAVARYSDDALEMSATTSGPETMEMLIVDNALFMKAPSLSAEGKWMKVDLDQGGLFGMLGKSMDPQVLFKAMEEPKSLELVGEEEIDGVQTNHYRITMDPKDYMEALELPEEMAEFLPKEVTAQMWLDADNLPRKFAQSTTTPSVAGGPETKTDVEGFYSDFGSDVEIEAPPADQVIDAPALPGSQ